MRMYLVQRGRINNNYVKEMRSGIPMKHIGITGKYKTGFVSLEYMGAAEFEWGAIPRAYRRIMSNFDKYQLFIEPATTTGGVPLVVFCKTEDHDAIIGTMHEYLLDKLNKTTISRYRLKEWINFEKHFDNDLDEFDMRHMKDSGFDNFWWDIENDFMFFIGTTDRQKAFIETVTYDHDEWYMTLPEEER